MRLGEIARRYGGGIGEERRERREGGLQIFDKPERDALVLSLTALRAALCLVASGRDGLGGAGKTLADIDVAEGDPFENARSLLIFAGSRPSSVSGCLSSAISSGGAKSLAAAPTTRSRKPPGTVRATGTPAESSMTRS